LPQFKPTPPPEADRYPIQGAQVSTYRLFSSIEIDVIILILGKYNGFYMSSLRDFNYFFLHFFYKYIIPPG
jgi:hypothetical protein